MEKFFMMLPKWSLIPQYRLTILACLIVVIVLLCIILFKIMSLIELAEISSMNWDSFFEGIGKMIRKD